ncbi:hypothetical protein LZC95_01625 [Pendulispora brunnea]|uniref:Copper type II ascorbate-dependent monooxygenase C-terminal domain-containing protein n=1 Tax=Pendulispora brunnea TaxID=2905690 RepID=A0ABZ2KGM1_9BACT
MWSRIPAFQLASAACLPAIAIAFAGIGNLWRMHDAPSYSYDRDIAPIVNRRCVHCHSSDGLAARPRLDSYEALSKVGATMKYMVQARMMPPWIAENSGTCRTWNDSSWLTDGELSTLVHWQEQGMPRGDPTEPLALERKTLPELGRADVTLDTGADYVAGLGASAYRCFVVDPGLSRDRMLTGIRVESSDPRMVAQVTIFSTASSEADAEATRLDQEDLAPGYSCYGSPRLDAARLVASWTWGAPSLPFPEGTGLRLAAGRKMVVQVHYNVITSGLGVATRTRVDLRLDDVGQVREASFVALSAGDIALAPGKVHVEAEGERTVDRPATVLAVAPQMHTLGRTMQIDHAHGASRDCAANFDHWNFYSQRLFIYEKPLRLELGDRLEVTCVYNTESMTRPVHRGETIRDEECKANLYIVSN